MACANSRTLSPFLEDLWSAADTQGVPLEGAISEYAPGQFELTLKHGPDALRAADEALMYKRLAKGVAARHGYEATFMAKPFSGRSGSGLHLHVSVNDTAGNNIFAAEEAEGAPVLRHAIGGMKALLGESMAIFAPNANSYRRFRANSYAPVSPTWGVNNRTVPLRVPAGAAHTRHIEHRMAGADANPYLALAALLAGVHHGIRHAIDPGPATQGDGYAAAAKSHATAFRISGRRRWMRSTGPRFCATILAIASWTCLYASSAPNMIASTKSYRRSTMIGI